MEPQEKIEKLQRLRKEYLKAKDNQKEWGRVAKDLQGLIDGVIDDEEEEEEGILSNLPPNPY